MKVTLIGTLPPIKGNAYYCLTLARTLSKKIKIDFISFKRLYPEFIYPGGTLESDDYIEPSRDLSVKKIITYYNPLSWLMTGLIAKSKVVHCQWWSIPTSPILTTIFFILKLRRKKLVLTVHNVLPHEQTFFDKVLTKMPFYFADKFIVHSERNKQGIMEMFGIEEDKIITIPMGVHDMYTISNLNKEEARKKLGFEKKDKVLLLFGNIRKYKGVDNFIESFSIIKKEIRNSKLLIAGQLWGDWSYYNDLIEKYNLKNDVRYFLDYIKQSEVESFFKAADIVVLPYKSFDGQSGIGNIALAFNKPLVVTNVGGLPDLVKDRKVIIEPNNPKIMAKKVISVLRDKNFMKKLSRDSKSLSKKYSWDSVGDKLINIYKDLNN